MSNLLVISNHPPERWAEEQKEGWDRIDYIPFPQVPATASFEQVVEIATPLARAIGEWLSQNPDGKVCLQGEFTLCYILFRSIDDYIFVFPTTERVVEERQKADGSTEKIATFKFVRWR
ncbi:MAG: hypothetical protein QXV73_03950 [Candidatus Micrarchaeia archaeon]